ncbi:MAG: hypothetical protein ACTSU5_00355 [Promethearchaeota archaeon]
MEDLEQNGFKFDANPETIPQSIGYQIREAEQAYKKLRILIEFGESVVLFLISDVEDEDIRERLRQCVREFEATFSKKTILEATSLLPYEQTILILAKYLATRIVMDFFIPQREKLPPDKKPNFNDKVEEVVYGAVTDFDDVADIVEKLEGKIGEDAGNVKGILLIFWIRGLIVFRLRIEDWDLLEQTPDAARYLQDGSEEQKSLIKEMGGEGKIVRFLSHISEPKTMADLKKATGLPEFTIKKFLQVLLRKGLIRLVRVCPKLYHIPESELPMLVIKGLTENDTALIEEMEGIVDGTRTISEISLELEEKPDRIEKILRLLNDFVIWDNESERVPA